MLITAVHESESGPERTCQRARLMSAHRGEADSTRPVALGLLLTHSRLLVQPTRLPMREQSSSASTAEKIGQFILQLACQLRDSTRQGQTGRDLIFLRNHPQKAPWKGDGIRAYY
jgi:hypothetical protein